MTQSDELFKKVDEGEEVYSSFRRRVKENLLIFDKTIPEWWEIFGVRIEEDNLTPELCRQLLAKVSNLYQEASYYYSLASSSSSALESSQSSTHTEKYAEVVSGFRKKEQKIPAAATIEQLVKAEQDEIYSAIANSKITKDFFKTVLDSLNTVRKILDTTTMNNGIEAKLLPHNSYRTGDS